MADDWTLITDLSLVSSQTSVQAVAGLTADVALAGTLNSAQIWRSSDAASSWTKITKLSIKIKIIIILTIILKIKIIIILTIILKIKINLKIKCY